jgi:glucosamine-6-phosphate isomerase
MTNTNNDTSTIMEIKIYKDYDALSNSTSDEIVEAVKKNPAAILCLASGDTPRLAYSLTAKKAIANKVDFSRCTFVALDEWMGVPPDNSGSCQFFLRRHLFDPLHIPENNIHFFDALSTEPQEECEKMNDVIHRKRGIDLMVVGIGMNGHVGFNEPGQSFQQYAHVVDLDETSKVVGQKYFQETTILSKGLTLGLQHMLEAKKVLLIASGLKKAEIIKKTIEEEISPQIPATSIRSHANGYVMLDEEAASALAIAPRL